VKVYLPGVTIVIRELFVTRSCIVSVSYRSEFSASVVNAAVGIAWATL